MKERKWYFSLRCKGGNAYHKSGELLKRAERIVNVGETQDCDVRYEAGEFKPSYYATILLNDDGQSWRIVRRSAHTEVQIEGKGSIGYAHPLADGDIIRFGGQAMALQFRTHHDDRYEVEKPAYRLGTWVVLLVAALLVAGSLFWNFGKPEPISEEDVASLEESIYLLRVDSVQQRLLTSQGTDALVRPAKSFGGDGPTGTAFLTTDSVLVTARHCVEFWLGTNLDLTTKVASLAEDDVVRWAIETETFNQMHGETGDSVMQMRVFFSLYNFMGDRECQLVSTDPRVHINTAHDGVLLMADFSQEYYWRTIRPYFVDKEMMLGDVVWVDGFSEGGKVALATLDEVRQMRRGTELMICGYPMTGMGEKKVAFAQGRIKREVRPEQENLSFESNINHGFSGGPVFRKVGSKVVAVGVVSRVDSVSSGIDKWGVPVTEIQEREQKK